MNKEEIRSKILQCRKELKELYKERDTKKSTWKQCLYRVQEAHRNKDSEKAAAIAFKMHRISKRLLNIETLIANRALRQRDLQTKMILLKVKMGEI